MYKLICGDNMNFDFDGEADLIFCDPVYESLALGWIDKYWNFLKPSGIFCVITDYHSSAEIKIRLSEMKNANFLNWLIWKNEFGNFRKDRFRQAHDDILIFSKGKDYKFYPERVQVPKVTANAKGLNPSGRTTKLATSVITDICLTTVSNERVKKDDGHCLRWQKPQALYARVLSPYCCESDLILDPFMGSGSLGCWCIRNFRDYVGIENDPEVFELAKKNISLENSLIENREIYKQLSFV